MGRAVGSIPSPRLLGGGCAPWELQSLVWAVDAGPGMCEPPPTNPRASLNPHVWPVASWESMSAFVQSPQLIPCQVQARPPEFSGPPCKPVHGPDGEPRPHAPCSRGGTTCFRNSAASEPPSRAADTSGLPVAPNRLVHCVCLNFKLTVCFLNCFVFCICRSFRNP